MAWKKLAFDDDVISNTLLTTTGYIVYASGNNTPARLGVGTNGHVLTLAAGVPSWAAATGGPPDAHKNNHDPADGSDPLDTAAAVDIPGVQAAGAGSAHTFARSDHAHQIQESFADNHIVTVNAADIAANDIARFTATGGQNGMTYAELAAAMALDDIGVPDAAVDINGQQATDLVVHTVANDAGKSGVGVVAGKILYQADTKVFYGSTGV